MEEGQGEVLVLQEMAGHGNLLLGRIQTYSRLIPFSTGEQLGSFIVWCNMKLLDWKSKCYKQYLKITLKSRIQAVIRITHTTSGQGHSSFGMLKYLWGVETESITLRFHGGQDAGVEEISKPSTRKSDHPINMKGSTAGRDEGRRFPNCGSAFGDKQCGLGCVITAKILKDHKH